MVAIPFERVWVRAPQRGGLVVSILVIGRLQNSFRRFRLSGPFDLETVPE
jgi:hypothetical protein